MKNSNISFYGLTLLLVLVPALSSHAFAGGHSLVEAGELKKESLAGYDEYDGHYDFNQQIETIRKLKAEGKEIHLIIGRGNNQEWHPLPPQEKNVVWVFADVAGSALTSKEGQLHLWLNMDETDHLKKLDDGLFSRIIFDGGVLYGFQNKIEDFHQYARILKPHGTIIFNPMEHKAITEDDEIAFRDLFFASVPAFRKGDHYRSEKLEELQLSSHWIEYVSAEISLEMPFIDFLRSDHCKTPGLISEENLRAVEAVLRKEEEIDRNLDHELAQGFHALFLEKFAEFKELTYHHQGDYPLVSGKHSFFEATKR